MSYVGINLGVNLVAVLTSGWGGREEGRGEGEKREREREREKEREEEKTYDFHLFVPTCLRCTSHSCRATYSCLPFSTHLVLHQLVEASRQGRQQWLLRVTQKVMR